jgi:hypothetical protein
MAVICVTITESREQVVAGIPKTISISTNVAATIFYTLDGTTPTLFSTMYTGPIFLPFNSLVVHLSVLATNGTDYSPVVTETYQTNMVHGNARLPHAATNARPGDVLPDTYPFGTPPYQPNQKFRNPADSGVTVYNPEKPATPTGFDANGNPTGFTNKPFNSKHYQITYTTTNAEGETGPNIGNLPGQVDLPYPSDIQPDMGQESNQGPEQTNQFTTTFDPRAMVIFQDFSKEDPNDPPQINRQFFSMENPERARDGTFFYNTGVDATAPVSGSFVRAHFNPRDNTITHYYRDSWSNKWIISTAPYVPNGSYDGNLSQIPQGLKGSGAGVVFEWIPFQRRVLF